MRAVLLIVFMFGLINPVFADILQLNSGEEIEGKIIEAGPDRVRFDISGVEVTYYRDEIEDVRVTPVDPPPAETADEIAKGKQEMPVTLSDAGESEINDETMIFVYGRMTCGWTTRALHGLQYRGLRNAVVFKDVDDENVSKEMWVYARSAGIKDDTVGLPVIVVGDEVMVRPDMNYVQRVYERYGK
jgi:hypothetical protein